MLRRSALVLIALLSFAPTALADSPPDPAVRLEVDAHDTTITTAGAPTQVSFTLNNRGRESARLRVETLVCLLPSMRVPLRVTSMRVGSREVAGREIELAAGQQATLTVTFEGMTEAAARESSWSIELRGIVRGEVNGQAHGVSTVRRATRQAAAR